MVENKLEVILRRDERFRGCKQKGFKQPWLPRVEDTIWPQYGFAGAFHGAGDWCILDEEPFWATALIPVEDKVVKTGRYQLFVNPQGSTWTDSRFGEVQAADTSVEDVHTSGGNFVWPDGASYLVRAVGFLVRGRTLVPDVSTDLSPLDEFALSTLTTWDLNFGDLTRFEESISQFPSSRDWASGDSLRRKNFRRKSFLCPEHVATNIHLRANRDVQLSSEVDAVSVCCCLLGHTLVDQEKVARLLKSWQPKIAQDKVRQSLWQRVSRVLGL